MTDPLVSVIIPVYNAQPFLMRGYAQVKAQTYENIEIIFVDNNSSDNTQYIVQDIHCTDPRVNVYLEKKQGAAAARNLGIRKSTGDLIAFFDIDDLWEPDRIEKHVSILNAHPEVDLVFSRLEKYYEEDPSSSYIVPRWDFQRGIMSPPYTGLVWMQYFFALPGIHACTLRRSVIDKVGGFPEFLRRGEDAAFLFKCGMEVPVFFDASVVGRYIRHKFSTVSVQNATQDPAVVYYYQRKHFYAPYVLKRYGDNIKIVRLLNRVVFGSLISCAFLQCNNLTERVAFIRRELKVLRVRGWGNWKLLSMVFMCVLFPEDISKYVRRVILRTVFS